MSVLIRGMGMPKSCNYCPLHFYEGQGFCSCRALGAIEDDEILKPWKKRRKDCPLIPVQQHGRLIDVDMAYDEFLNLMEIQGAIDPCQLGRILVCAPTIIPASEED